MAASISLLCCSRYGKYETIASNSRPTKASNFPAKINVKVNLQGQCTISKVVLEHNHALSSEKSRHFWCNQTMSMQARRSLKINDATGIQMNKNYSSIVEEAGGHKHMTFGERQAREYVRKTRLELEVGDAEALQQYFSRMQQKNNGFYYIMDINDEGRLSNVFWADARSRAAYEEFGDVITFDSTYLTNKYEMPFCPFVGVNHHEQSILLSCALLSNEDTNTFIWLFRAWLDILKMFVAQHDNALRNKAEKEDKADFTCFNTKLLLVSDQHVEKQFTEVYTHEIMKKFQAELKGMSNCNVQHVTSDGSMTTYKVTEFVLARDKITRTPIMYSIQINEDAANVECLCSLFNFKGIVCRHTVFAMNIHGMHIIPKKYILRRWRKYMLAGRQKEQSTYAEF